jgi:hypothetical protein
MDISKMSREIPIVKKKRSVPIFSLLFLAIHKNKSVSADKVKKINVPTDNISIGAFDNPNLLAVIMEIIAGIINEIIKNENPTAKSLNVRVSNFLLYGLLLRASVIIDVKTTKKTKKIANSIY